MKKIFILTSFFALFAISSCKKENLMKSNATLTASSMVTLSMCSAQYYFKIDGKENESFAAENLPDDFKINYQGNNTYTTRVYIEYQSWKNPYCSFNKYIKVNSIRKIN